MASQISELDCLLNSLLCSPDSKVYGANMGPTWGQQDSGGPHICPMNFAIWVTAKKTSKLHATVPLFGNLLVTSGFPRGRANDVEIISMSWHHHALKQNIVVSVLNVWWTIWMELQCVKLLLVTSTPLLLLPWHWVISGIVYAGRTSPCFPRWRIWSTCTTLLSRMTRNANIFVIFMKEIQHNISSWQPVISAPPGVNR